MSILDRLFRHASEPNHPKPDPDYPYPVRTPDWEAHAAAWRLWRAAGGEPELSRGDVYRLIAEQTRLIAPTCVEFTGLHFKDMQVRCGAIGDVRGWAEFFGVRKVHYGSDPDIRIATAEGRTANWRGYDVTVYCQTPLKPLAHYARLAAEAKEIRF